MANGQTHKALPAIMAILAAVISYVSSCGGHPWWGLILAILAIPLGLVGMLAAASPRVTGGIMSVAAMVLGALGVIVAILGIVGKGIQYMAR